MEGRIKNRDLWLIWKQLPSDANTLCTRRIVERSEVTQFFNAAERFLIDNHRVPKILTPVNNAMAHCVNLILQQGPQVINYAAQGGSVIRVEKGFFDFLVTSVTDLQQRFRGSQAFRDPTCQN